MKEIKTYVRISRVDQVVQALEKAGVKGMVITDVSAVHGWADPAESELSVEYLERYSRQSKIEFFCDDPDVGRFVDVIKKAACTNQPGDGLIFVTRLEQAEKIGRVARTR